MIGDITWCEVCPRLPRRDGPGQEMAVRTVMNVETVAPDQYREAGYELHRARSDQLHG